MQRLLASVALCAATAGVHATVSEYTEFFIPYERAQSGYVCLDKQIMEAEFGIPLASLMEGIFPKPKPCTNNLAAPARIKISTCW